jgi:glyoxylase I family protein
MEIEHLGMNVEDPVALADWYVAHLGMRIVSAWDEPLPVRFLADSAGHVMIEVYCNPAAEWLDYSLVNPLVIHLAFSSENVRRDYARLLAAGATPASEPATLPSGDQIAVVRDPWSFPIQLVQRRQPMI